MQVSTAPLPSRPPPVRATANRSDIASTSRATGPPTPCCTAWPSPSSAATHRARPLHKARRNGHTKREAMRVPKRHLSNVVHRRMLADWHAHNGQNVLPQEAA